MIDNIVKSFNDLKELYGEHLLIMVSVNGKLYDLQDIVYDGNYDCAVIKVVE